MFLIILQVIWEYLGNDGLWMSLPDKLSFQIEAHYCEQRYNFGLGDTQDTTFHYHLSNMHRIPSVGSKHTQRIKRTPFIWDKPESKSHDCQMIITCIVHVIPGMLS